jgi:hypothetical protein
MVAIWLLALVPSAGLSNGNGQSPASQMGAQTWDKVKYLGGGLDVATTNWEKRRFGVQRWNNRLTVSAQAIDLKLADGRAVQIDPARVTAVGYNDRTYVREELSAAAVASPAGVILPWPAPPKVQHYIGIQYTLLNGLERGLLLQAHKDNYQAIFTAIKSVTKTTRIWGEPNTQRGDRHPR